MSETIQGQEKARILTSVRDVVLDAALAVQVLFEAREFQVSSKGEAGPVTSGDIVANFILRRGLMDLLPDAGWLSEESVDTSARLDREYVWVVDPIDGTREFVKGIPEYSVSVGLARAGEPVLGVIALPADGLIYYGLRGAGVSCLRHEPAGREYFTPAFWNFVLEATPATVGETLAGGFTFRTDRAYAVQESRVTRAFFSDRKELPGATLLVSASEHRRQKFAPLEGDFAVHPSGSIARKLGLLAGGQGDLVVSLYPKNEWDICGGTALVLAWPGTAVMELEHGGPVRFNSADPRSLGLVAGPAGLVKEFLQYFARKGLKLETTYE